MIEKIIREHQQTIERLHKECQEDILAFAELCRSALSYGNTIFFMGNGGSAADSQHLAAELVGRFQLDRRGLAAVALTTDTSILTAVGNDFGFEQVFARQVEALAGIGDVVVGLSTSGNSSNVVKALEAAKQAGAFVVGMTGVQGGRLAEICEICIRVPSEVTARIQESHILVGHIICQLIEDEGSHVSG